MTNAVSETALGSKIVIDSVSALRRITEMGELVSPWLVIDQALIDRFAETTGDHNWIHVNPERAAKETPYGKTIAHGMLTLSLVPPLSGDIFELRSRTYTLNYGFDKVRFISPVPVYSKIRGRFSLQSLKEVGPDQVRAAFSAVVEVEDAERPALAAIWLLQFGF